MTFFRRINRRLMCLAAFAGMCAVYLDGGSAFAAPIGNATWTGTGGSGYWSNPANWSTVPTTSGQWNLVFGGATQTTSTNTIGTITLGTMSFTNNGTGGRTATFTLSGSSLALSNSRIVTTAGGATDTIGNALTLSGSSTFALNNGHGLNLTGGVSGAGSITAVGSGTNTAILYVAGSNSYSGNTYVTGVRVQNALGNSITNTSDTNDNAFGSGEVFVSGSGTVLIRNSSRVGNNFTIGGDGVEIAGVTQGAIKGSFAVGGQTATLSGTVTLSDDATLKTASTAGLSGNKMVLSGPVNLGSRMLTLSPGASGTNATPIEITGAINGTGEIVVDGDGSSVLLSGANGYSGGTTITSGTLRAGSGTALGTGSLAVNADGLDLNGQALAIGTLSGSSGGMITSSVAGPASLSTNSAVLSNYLGAITDGAGVVSVIKTGIGELDLSGSNSYSGGTTVTAGRIQNVYGNSQTNQGGTNDYAFGTGLVTVSGSGTVAIRNSSTIANNFNIGGDGTTVGSSLLGAIRGSFGVSGQTAMITGVTTLSANAKIVTASSTTGLTGNSLVMSGSVNLGSSTLTLAPGVSGSAALPITISGAINGAGSIVVDGDGSSVLLSGANGYTGGTTITSGTLRAGSGTALGTGSLAVNAGGLDLNGQALAIGTLSGSSGGMITSSVAGPASLSTNSAVLSNYLGTITDGAGVVSVIKTGVGELDLSGSNSYSGGTTVTAGRIQNVYGNSQTNQGGTNNYAFGNGLVTASGSGTVVIRNSSTIANNFNIGGDGVQVLNVRSGSSSPLGAIRGSFGVNDQTATLTGAITLSADASIVTASSTTGLSGNSMVLSGSISLGSHTLRLAPGVSGSEPLPIFVSGAINGTGGVVIDGASTVYLNAANTYTGDTTVNAGTLAGSGTITGAVIVQSGTIAPGRLEGAIDTLTVGSLELTSGATAALTISDLSNYDRIVSSGTVDFGTPGGNVAVQFLANGFANFSAWQLFSGSDFTGHLASFGIAGSYGSPTFAYADGEWKADIGGGQTMSFYEDNRHAVGDRYKAGQLVVVPEPSSLAIAGVGLVIAGWYRLRRRRSA